MFHVQQIPYCLLTNYHSYNIILLLIDVLFIDNIHSIIISITISQFVFIINRVNGVPLFVLNASPQFRYTNTLLIYYCLCFFDEYF